VCVFVSIPSHFVPHLHSSVNLLLKLSLILVCHRMLYINVQASDRCAS